MKRHIAAISLLCIAGCSGPPEDESPVAGDGPAFVGSDSCAGCHSAEYAAWRSSHHRLAMQPAEPATVLGDFDDAVFDYFGAETRFSRDGDAYVISTPGETGERRDYRVTHTFGVEPLQQYLVAGERGRQQAVTIAWDSRPAATGGQRWYHLYPDEAIVPGDPLHWTGRYFTWNSMCAECHSTGVETGYDAANDSFATSSAEVSVGCEACHGPGSSHVAQADAGEWTADYGLAVDLDDRESRTWVMNPDTGIAALDGVGRQQQPEACGRCHARRSPITPDYEYGKPLADTHLPALLEEGLYHADGRIADEVYVYGSFLQSRMYAAGVTCSDCHDPHTARLATGPDPNAVCAQCHLPARFATADHAPADPGNCVDCHMPATTYMGVDPRRDHSFRIPGAGDHPAHYGQAIAAGRAGGANGVLLTAIANEDFPPIVRATLLTLIESPAGNSELAAIREQVDDPDPLVRIGALRALQVVPPRVRGLAGRELLDDPVRGVRIEAARALVEQRDLLDYEDRRAFTTALGEYRTSLETGSAMPAAAVGLAELETTLGNESRAERWYRHALRVGPDHAGAQHAWGLRLVRDGRHDEALTHLRNATDLEPSNPRFAYVFGVALNSLGRPDDAIAFLADARQRFPGDLDVGFALATMLRDSGQLERAVDVAESLAERYPESPQVARLLESLRSNAPAAPQ